jgi:hypothetical protein
VFARKFFPGQDAIGKRIHLATNGDKVAEIVGVVGHVKQWGLDADDTQSLRAQYYLSCMQMPDDFVAGLRSSTGMLLRYTRSLGAALDSLRQVNKQMSTEQVIFGEQSMAMAGVGAGIVGAIALTRLMRNLLFAVSSTDPIVLACVCALLLVVALAACLLPARRAASIEPMQALRTECSLSAPQFSSTAKSMCVRTLSSRSSSDRRCPKAQHSGG